MMKKENEIYMKLFGGRCRISHQRSPTTLPFWWWRSSFRKTSQATTACKAIFVFSVVAAFCLFSRCVDMSIFSSVPFPKGKFGETKKEFGLRCTKANETTHNYYPTSHNPSRRSRSSTCPPHFRWIKEDLRPWRETGITREMLEKARKTAHFRVVIVDGKVYVEKYRPSIQTRDLFTLWGILQLIRWYPGKLPDLELMFDCDDRPVIPAQQFSGPNSGPPPLFRYCSDDWSLDIVFPDWSFWGWAEINIKPWNDVLKNIKEGNKRTKWKDRVPYAYWKGNPTVAPTRADLMQCNVSTEHDWNTHLYIQDWEQESKIGFKQSNLGDQCTHRYKIYIEGWAWSVSEKYILACDAMTLYVEPKFYDFFIRGMVPLQHYWPIRDNSKCASLKFAVEWGNNHTDKAQAIGEAASNYIHENLKLDYVYDYMFHLLNEYAKLLKFKPIIPPAAVEVSPETMACSTNEAWRRFMEDSLVKFPSDSIPCTIPPDDTSILQDFRERKANSTREVKIWEDKYWESKNKGY